MRELSSYIQGNMFTARIERKFLMSAGQSYKAKMLFKSFHFKKAFPDRKVSSYYFDTIDFDALRENIDGVNIRDKLRVRYYNDDLSTSKIEIKHKRGDVGYKTNINLSCVFSDKHMLIKNVSDWCSINVNSNLIPTTHINYDRLYYERQWLRATFDTKIRAYRVVGSKLVPSPMREYEVIEFKYPVEYDNDFRDIYKELNWIALRNTKSSKYSNALMY